MQTANVIQKIVAHPYFALASVMLILFVLPQFGVAAVPIGSAAILSAMVWAQPERFQTRSGSMRLAIGLLAGMWLSAAVVTALALAGALRP